MKIKGFDSIHKQTDRELHPVDEHHGEQTNEEGNEDLLEEIARVSQSDNFLKAGFVPISTMGSSLCTVFYFTGRTRSAFKLLGKDSMFPDQF